MHLSYGILADAVVRTGGKWNALGILNVIKVAKTPAVHGTAGMLLRLDVRDLGEHELALHFVDATGNALGSPYKVPFAMTRGSHGQPVDIDVGVELRGFPLPEAGQFDFIISVDGRYLGSVPVEVRTP